jgi:glycosyltransferase involved in cell wall biosynthesis
MKICFFTPAYPGAHDTSHYAFVKQLVDAIAAQGNECHVVSPYNVLHYKKIVHRREMYGAGIGRITVYRPYFISFSGARFLQKISSASKKRALKKATRQLPNGLDFVYCHFWNSGYAGYCYAKEKHLPLFVATGESDIMKMFTLPADLSDFKDFVKGVICVSRKNRDESIQLGLTTEVKCEIFPNAVNAELFHKKNKIACRKQLGLPEEEFIVAFVGWFNDRKGSRRVSEALEMVGGIKSIFIGKGEQEPDCEGILFKGYLPHDKVPLYLSAADCFVLPTLAEGCCNAVVEAMACGLPIISSNLSFNWDVLDESNSILVEPTNVEQIAQAIKSLKEDRYLRDILSDGALKKAESLTIEHRAAAILSFINKMIGKR